MDKITIERETLNAAMMALEYLLEASPVMTTKHRDAYSTAARLRAALAAQPAEAQQEPVAWAVYKGDECLRVHEKREWAEDWARAEAHFGSVGPYHIRELFAAPPAQPDHQGHSCTHKCTWPQCEAAQPAPAQEPQPVSNTDELPQRLSDEMDAIAIKHAHKMALDLECILAEYGGSWYNTAMQTLGEYRSEMNAIHERESPTFMGEPLIAAAPKNLP